MAMSAASFPKGCRSGSRRCVRSSPRHRGARHHGTMANRGDRRRRPAHRGCGQCTAEGGGGAPAVDGVPAVRAVAVDPGTSRSRCARAVGMLPCFTPSADDIARVLVDRDGSTSGRPIGRRRSAVATSAGRRLATDAEARARRERALGMARDAATHPAPTPPSRRCWPPPRMRRVR